MKRTRLINLIALFVNLAIFFAFFVGFYFKFIEPCIKEIKLFNEIPKKLIYECRYYEFIAAVITMLASFFMMFANSKSMRRMRESTPRWIFTLRYISMGMSILIICSTLLAAVAGKGLIEDPKVYFNYKGYQFYWCFVMPVLSVLCFVLLELEPKCKFRKNFGPLIMWGIYCAGILAFMFLYYIPKTSIDDAAKKFVPYFIFLLTKDLIAASGYEINQAITISFFVITTVLSFVLPVLLRLLNRVLSSLIIGYEYVEIDGDDNVIRPINRPEKHKDIKKVETKPAKPIHYENIYRVYVNDRKLRNWKVVLPNKSIKVFATQQEALSFAADKARSSKGTVRVHTALGKLKFENQ